ncbi:ATP-dependent RNA helicase DDX24-like [Mizuhopecten yessoensis]|uniref:ATP-dependent RNA helicase n=1 Tax=Mizuhopecten yessoensis TaxID=6573 RepID=A0A210PVZ5_MIZYE|nr:ATP-dependent RNA helicase DDX24-like [Mizuhopecten yessoensis]OWF40635.1 ATP-dependent RNA helicase DDX24 [Mizuhopecten yessoensis]
MATSIHVKPKSKWKKIEITKGLGTGHDFSGLMCMEELTDYELITKTRKNVSKQGAKDTKEPVGPEKSEREISKKKTKDKKKKKKKKEENTTESPGEIEATDSVEKKKKKKKQKKGDIIKLSQVQTVSDLSEDLLKEESTHSKKKKKQRKRKKSEDTNQGEGPSPKKKKKADKPVVPDLEGKDENENKPQEKVSVTDMAAWKNMHVPAPVLLALKQDGFAVPTPIQTLAIPHAIRDRLDIVGAAETGSGKTLAFGIPLIDKILRVKQEQENRKKKGVEEEECGSGSDIEPQDEMNDEMNDEIDNEDDNESDNEMVDSGEESEEELLFETSDEDDEEEEVEQDDTEEVDISEDENDEEELGSEEEEELVEGDGFGCVKVIDDADFSDIDPSLLGQFEPVKTPKYPQKPPMALILEPTRELAVQVKNHLLRIIRHTDIKVVTVVGGLSMEKQLRVMKKCPEVVVATPGRLWELVQQDNSYLSQVSEIRCLVVDEADRMIEKGHFQELTHILNHINRDAEKKLKRQTFVFSATLTTIHSGPHRHLNKKVKVTEELKLEKLMKTIGLKDRPKIIDLTRKIGTVETLTEARINCTMDEKDLHLYYFLNQYPGRTLVFANSKDCIRRLVSVLTLLNVNPLPLHADMHQKQRLKNLEKFTDNPRGLLLASDVAARGLDIPNVQHVVHYQVPHTVENYIHRSGRTARATKEGLSIMLVGQGDVKNYRKVVGSLNRSEELPVFPVNHQILTVIKERVDLAKQLDKLEHSVSKQKRQNSWFEKASKEVDIDLDETLLNDLGDSHYQSTQKQQIKFLNAELKALLKTSVIPKNFSGKYPTRTGRLVIPHTQALTKDAIENVKNDRKSQQKMMDKIRVAALTAKPGPEKKKKKWKKKWGK